MILSAAFWLSLHAQMSECWQGHCIHLGLDAVAGLLRCSACSLHAALIRIEPLLRCTRHVCLLYDSATLMSHGQTKCMAAQWQVRTLIRLHRNTSALAYVSDMRRLMKLPCSCRQLQPAQPEIRYSVNSKRHCVYHFYVASWCAKVPRNQAAPPVLAICNSSTHSPVLKMQI